MEIDGAVALVTGAAGAIGSVTARKLAANGARLVLTDRDADRLEQVATQLADTSGIAVATVVGDVTDEEHHRRAVEVAGDLGGPDIAVLNAGIYLPGLAWELPLEQWELQMRVNFWGVLYGLRVVLPGMIARDRGHVVAVSSGAGLIATPGLSAYVASKHAVVGLLESVRHELARVAPAVGASVVCPGNVRSDMAANSLAAAGLVSEELDPTVEGLVQQVRDGVAHGSEPTVVAEAIVDAVRNDRFWVLSHPEIGWAAVDRMKRAAAGDEPVDFLA